MGLTMKATGFHALDESLDITKSTDTDKVIALAGNPNVGKSTVFNGLTGLKQHTGNWAGKTVTNAAGVYKENETSYIMVDLPGTFSLMPHSAEEEVARDFISFGNKDASIVVCDATCLERNLNLVLQTIEINRNVIVCLNFMDEAKRKHIRINTNQLEEILQVPVITTSARQKDGLSGLKDALRNIDSIFNKYEREFTISYSEPIEKAIQLISPYLEDFQTLDIQPRWICLRLLDYDEALWSNVTRYLKWDPQTQLEFLHDLTQARKLLKESGYSTESLRDEIVRTIIHNAETVSSAVTSQTNERYNKRQEKLNHILTSKKTGIPCMLLLFCVTFWITIVGANYPSELLTNLLFGIEHKLATFMTDIGAPLWLKGALVDGIFRVLAWVVSVMLPPMAIFFPMFTLLEDFGYLPRIAFNLDHIFKKVCACGKQSLCMCMGLGCNACGVVGCRIIDSRRERLIAILTNSFVPCNGRFPAIISILTMFFIGVSANVLGKGLLSALLLTIVILVGVIMTFLNSFILSKTLLKGEPSSFTLELPPFRKPQIGKVIIHSVFDRTLFVLGRAVVVAAPAGLIIWLMSNLMIDERSILQICSTFLDPFAKTIGLDGVILIAFILGFPANEIVIPIIIMGYMSTGKLMEIDNLAQLRQIFIANGWTSVTAICTILFSLFHWPCSTTCLTIHKETKSWKWTFIAIIMPTITGIVLCFLVNNLSKLFGL